MTSVSAPAGKTQNWAVRGLSLSSGNFLNQVQSCRKAPHNIKGCLVESRGAQANQTQRGRRSAVGQVSSLREGRSTPPGAQSQQWQQSSPVLCFLHCAGWGTCSKKCSSRGGRARWLSKLSICYTNPIPEFLKNPQRTGRRESAAPRSCPLTCTCTP